jgi:uncharacterized membrane protein
MKTLRLLLLAGLIALAPNFVGCGGGGAKVQTQSRSTTKGQELMDLEEAYKKGIITEKEYNKQKKQILKEK